jgi:hypothetical protein
MSRRCMSALLIGAVSVALIACGGGGSDEVSASDAKSAVEKAAGVTLKSQQAPAKEVEAAYSGTDAGQIIQLFVLKDTDDAADIKKQLEKATGSAGGLVKSAVNKNVIVIAGSVPGQDSKVDEVLAAVKGL